MKRLLGALVVLVAASGSLGAAEADRRVLTLDEALRMARMHHPQLQAAHAQTDASTAKIDSARAPLLPQVTGTASYQRATRNATINTTAPSGLPSTSSGIDSTNQY